MENKKITAILLLAGIMLVSLCMTLPAKAQSATFTITDQVSTSHSQGYVGDTLTLTGSGYTPGEYVDINCVSIGGDTSRWIDGVTDPILVDSSGNFQADLPIGDGTIGGAYVLQAVGEDSAISVDAAPFTVLPSIVFDRSIGSSGDIITVSGYGFIDPSGDEISATFGGNPLTLDSVDYGGSNDGSFTATFTVPSNTPNSYQVVFFDTIHTSNSASEIFTITSISPLPEYPLGGLVALFACFATFILYTKRKSFPRLIHF